MNKKPLVSLLVLIGVVLCHFTSTAQPLQISVQGRTNQGTALCPVNLDFEFGNFTNWETNTGRVTVDPSGTINILTHNSPVWLSGNGEPDRHELISRPGSPSIDKYGGFPVNPPFGGDRYALKIGSDGNDPTSFPLLPNALSESVRYKIDVPKTGDEYSILFAFAVVLENPDHPDNLHTYGQQPRFLARMYELGGDTLPCVNFTYVASDPNLPFQTSSIYKVDSANAQYPGGINFAPVKYLPWTQVFVNLKPYRGKTLYLEFTTTDCTKRGHFGYAYVDVIECNYSLRLRTSCNQNNTLLDGPDGPFQMYEWYNADYSRKYGNGKNLVLSESLPANEKINLVLTPFANFGCKDTLTGNVKKIIPPSVDVGGDKNTCRNQSVQIGTDPSPGLTYQWSPAIFLSGTNQSRVTSTPQRTTTYTLTVTDPLTGCTASDDIIVKVDTSLSVKTDSGSVCLGSSIVLTASGNADLYIWSPATGLSSTTGSRVTASPASTVTYTVTGFSSQSGCSGTATSRVIVNPLPTGLIRAASAYLCEGKKVVLNASGGSSYEWYIDGQIIPGVRSDILNADKAGTYTAKIISDSGCTAMAAQPVTLPVYLKPKADFIAPWGCRLKNVQFINQSNVLQAGTVSWKWELGDGNVSYEKNPSYLYREGDLYEVRLIVIPQQCPLNADTVTRLVRISKGLNGERYPTVNTLPNTPTPLMARPGVDQYVWSPSSGLNNSGIRNPIYNYDRETEYLIRVRTQEGCDAVDTLQVLLFKQEDVQVPTAFSPNGDGRNDYLDVFLIGIREIKFWVFNRWGQLLFETTDPAQRWDGTYMGKKQPLENYVWIAEAVTNSGRKIRKRGQTILIR